MIVNIGKACRIDDQRENNWFLILEYRLKIDEKETEFDEIKKCDFDDIREGDRQDYMEREKEMKIQLVAMKYVIAP